MQRRLQLGRDGGAFDEAAFAIAMPGKAPEIGAIVDVQRGLQPVLARQFQRLDHRRRRAGMRQVGARGDDRPGLRDKAFVDVIFAQRHVGAVLAVKDQRELLVIADTQQDQRGQAFRIGLYTPHIHAFARQFFADEAAHMFIADAGDQRGFQAKACGACGHIGGAAPDVFLE